MGMISIDKMWERIEIARQDSDTSLFFTLMYFGEMVVKIVGAGLIAAIDDDRERHRYRQEHRLVRADGIGDWPSTIDEILSGPAAQILNEQSREEQRELTSKNGLGTWQFEAVTLIQSCICIIEPGCEKLPQKLDGRRWLSLFAELRNQTRGHGALLSETCGSLCEPLEQSIHIFTENFRLFQRPWAYLYRNLSGKYRVTKLTQPSSEFDVLKTSQSVNIGLQDGVYVYYDKPHKADLIYSGVDAQDFFFPNGNFNGKTYELISYITNNKYDADASQYLAPATALPPSETQGIGILDAQGNGKSYGNLPPIQNGYIRRTALETDLFGALINDRHPIITLLGRGGIGKTWLTLTVLHRVASEGIYTAILWFSSRDIDLLPSGPKLVTPHVLTANDIAKEFVRLIDPPEAQQKGFDSIKYLAEKMTRSDFGPILFVFDNFETVRAPSELYAWIDTYIRLPNKVLITSRIREFKGDYPIEVFGMNEEESDELIKSTANALGIDHMLTEDYKHELYEEASGHPYVMKVLLGEVAKAGKLSKVERIVATMEDILEALFERTYSGLSPVAKRVFLTLCVWRSAVPLLALEAVLLRPSNERMDVANAAEELNRSSFIEISSSSKDGELFLTVPLVAAVFGKPKLATSPMRSAIEADLQLLYAFGATQQSEIERGILPRVDRLFHSIAERITQGKDNLDNHLPMLEFVARRYPPAWLLLGRLCQELGDLEKAKEAFKRYIESGYGDFFQKEKVWEELANNYQQTTDYVGEIHALVEMCQLPNIAFRVISNTVNRVNALFSEQYFVLDSEEKRVVSRRLAQVMENRISEGDATDCSRLAWLFIRLQEEEKAREIIQVGLSVEPDNLHCKNLATRISNHRF
jgi:tetratricopeptide (TPR) repeat protein